MNTAKNIALLTGVSRAEGLGFETARQLAEKGWTVLLTARQAEQVETLADRLRAAGFDARAFPLDITDPGSVARLAEQVQAQFGRIDALINNAGAFFDAGAQPLETDLAYAREAFDTNLFGAWRMAQAFVPLLRQSAHPRIVQVSSGAGSFNDPVFGLNNHPQHVPVYALTKLALNGLSVKLARQLKDEGMLVNSVCPGFVATWPGTAEWGARPVSEGAKGIVWAATLPDDGPTGGFFRDGQALAP